MKSWKELEGRSVAGRYVLGAVLHSDPRSASFSARRDSGRDAGAHAGVSAPHAVGEGQRHCAVHLTLCSRSGRDDNGIDDRLQRDLEAAVRLHHPCLVAVEKAGRTRLGEDQFIFAVLEPTEEELSAVLRERALTRDETAQLAESLVAALGTIHDHGLIHGQVNPANVLAAGNTVKLSTHCVRRCPLEARPEFFAQDVGDLGATLFEALTRRRLTSDRDPAIGKLPSPFRSIVQSAVSGRWGLPEIALSLKTQSFEEIRHPIPNTVGPSHSKPVENVAARGLRQVRHAVRRFAPALTGPRTLQSSSVGVAIAERDRTIEGGTPSARLGKKLLMIGVVGLLLTACLLWFFQHTGTVAAKGASTQVHPPVGNRLAKPMARVAPPAAAAAAGAAAVNVPAVPAAPPTQGLLGTPGHPVWRVVAYAFGDQAAAETQTRQIAASHPEWKPEVFRPSNHGMWLVTLGGTMDRDQATAFSKQVRKTGSVTDAYAQNYSH